MKYPTMFRDLAYRQQANSGIIDLGFLETVRSNTALRAWLYSPELKTKSVYSPALRYRKRSSCASVEV